MFSLTVKFAVSSQGLKSVENPKSSAPGRAGPGTVQGRGGVGAEQYGARVGAGLSVGAGLGRSLV